MLVPKFATDDMKANLHTRISPRHHGKPPQLQHQAVTLRRLEGDLADQGKAGAGHLGGQK